MDALLQWNCRGCIHHSCELKMILAKYTPFCVCLQETHFRPNQPYSLKGYQIFRKDVIPDRRAQGGVAIFMRQEVHCINIPLNTALQAVAVRISVPFIVTVCNLYLPEFNWQLRDLEDLILQLPSPFLLLGDFNAHSPLWGPDSLDTRGRLIEQFLDNSGSALLNTGAVTRFNARSNTFSAIDLTIVSPQLAPRLLWKPLDHLYGSDHFPITISTGTAITYRSIPKKWQLKRANWNSFQQQLISIDVHEHDSIEKDVNILSSAIIRAAELSIPLSSGNVPKVSVPWWNGNVKEAVKKKKRAFNTFRRNPTTENLIKFKKCRAEARRIILESKRSSWSEYVSTIRQNTPISEVWRKVRAIAGTKSTLSLSSLYVQGRTITDALEIIEILATHFQLTSSSTNYDATFLNNKNNREIFLDFETGSMFDYNAPFSLGELEEAVRKSTNTSPGPDRIPYEFIRYLTSELTQFLLNLYNRIWSEGFYPNQWKEAIVIPLLKQGKDPRLPSSYRPISLTCCLSKILERMVNNRLVWYLETHNLIAKHQSGFRKRHSTTDHLVHLENAIQDSFLKREHLVAVFFDLEKAYDMTWRHGVLEKMYRWGFRGNLPKFIQSFLSDRRLRVRNGDMLSTSRFLENGIPQGSTLSVTLFAIAVNDLAASLQPEIGKCMYVDDIVIFASGPSIPLITSKLQRAIGQVVNDAESHGFKFSPTKTSCIHFCRLRKPHQDPILYIKSSQIACQSSVRFLGLVFDKKLNWHRHIEDLLTRCNKSLNVVKCLASIKWGADKDVLLRLYKSLVLSKMDYGCVAYSSARSSVLKKLDTIHHAGIRCALGAFRTSPVNSLYCESGIPSLSRRRERMLLSYMSTIRAQQNHQNYSTLFQSTNRYCHRPTVTRPAGIRAHELLENFHIHLPMVLPARFCEVPPWLLPKIVARLELTMYQKQDTSSILIKQKFFDILSEYPRSKNIYTDGSKTEKGIGCAFSVCGETYSWSLTPFASVYTAELYAIWQALHYCTMHHDTSTFLICTDCLSAVQNISNAFTSDPLVQLILSVLDLLSRSNKTVIFVWVPSHVGIPGNESADLAARVEANKDHIDTSVLRHDDLKVFLRSKINDMWQSDWNQNEGKLKSIKPSVRPWKSVISLSRREQVVLTRLRLGHSALTSAYLLVRSAQPICENCDTPLTIRHILEECRSYEAIRERFQLRNDVGYILGNDPDRIRAVLQFCKAAGLFYKL